MEIVIELEKYSERFSVHKLFQNEMMEENILFNEPNKTDFLQTIKIYMH